ncbi:hypothetical protein BH11VER1_BH11VER1_24030 [soil metagenome]
MASSELPSQAAEMDTHSLIMTEKLMRDVMRLILCPILPYLMVSSLTPAIAETAPSKKPAQGVSNTSSKKTKATTSGPASQVEKPEVKPEVLPIEKPVTASNVAIASADLREFAAQPESVKKLIESSLELAKQNLTYTYGSSDPVNGGLDCSGFIYYVLRQHGFSHVPRDSSGQYVWVRSARGFRAVISRKMDGFEMDELLPGDLLFWTGTYASKNDPPISHVMLYLGTEKSTDAKVMIGSSDGRTYRDQRRNGVSVFDFKLPKAVSNGDSQSVFVGYGCIPGLRE